MTYYWVTDDIGTVAACLNYHHGGCCLREREREGGTERTRETENSLFPHVFMWPILVVTKR